MSAWWRSYKRIILFVLAILGFLSLVISDEFQNGAAKLWIVFAQNLSIAECLVLIVALLLLLAVIAGTYLLIKGYYKYTQGLRLNVSIHSAGICHTENIREVMSSALLGRSKKGRRRIKELMRIFVETYAQNSARLREEGRYPLLASNFDIYAQCVGALMEAMADMQCSVPPNIHTFLRRPLFDWYNLLNDFVMVNGVRRKVVFTRKWWERYKALSWEFAHQREGIRMFRYIIHPEKDEIKKFSIRFYDPFCVYAGQSVGHFEPPLIEQLLLRGHRNPDIELVSEIKAWFEGVEGTPEESRLHCIGEVASGSSPSNEWVRLLDHFQSIYHTGNMKHRNIRQRDKSGVFYGYLQTVTQDFRHWLRYRDVFAVEVPLDHQGKISEAFGIALCDDASWDVTGIRVMPEGDVRKLIAAFNGLRDKVSPTFCLYEGIDR